MAKVSPRINVAFKKIFGVEENKDLLISLINSIVSEEDQMEEIILLNPYHAKNFEFDNLSILEVKAKSKEGKRFHIQIQIRDEADYDKKGVDDWAKLYTEQLKAKEDYACLSKAIDIHILNFLSILETPQYHNVFSIRAKESNLLYSKNLELHTLELEKFSPFSSEELNDWAGKGKSTLDMWLGFLTQDKVFDQERLPAPFDKPAVKKALGVLEAINFTSEEQEVYENRLKWFRIQKSTLKKYQAKGFEKGKAEGKVEGKAEGIAEGKAQGKAEEIAEGKAEGKAEVAKELLAENLDVAFIVKVTGLSLDEIETLKRELLAPLRG